MHANTCVTHTYEHPYTDTNAKKGTDIYSSLYAYYKTIFEKELLKSHLAQASKTR